MAIRKITVIKEMTIENGSVGERRIFVEYDDKTNQLIRPDCRLKEKGRKKWDDVMKTLSKIKGNDLRCVIDGPALLDYCISFD